MIPEIGHFALILALSLAFCQGILPMWGAHRNDSALMAVGRNAAYGQLFFVAISFFLVLKTARAASDGLNRSLRCLKTLLIATFV